jgi:predicted DNA binding CopG/RHH family protein
MKKKAITKWTSDDWDKMYQSLDSEEKNLYDSYENDEFIQSKNIEERKRELKQAAINTLKESVDVTTKLSVLDLNSLKLNAGKEGIPVPEYVASILHKFVIGKLTVVENKNHKQKIG